MVLLFVSIFVMLIIGVPIAMSLAGASMLWVYVTQRIPDFIILQRMVGGVNSFPLLAVPFFILAGNLMNAAGLTTHIFAFARSIVGWMRGGLGHVNVGASIIFAGMSGAAVADAGGLGTIEIKAMTDAGYDTDISVAITAASSTIGPIIPPSLPLVIYGVIAQASIGRLFIAGIVPGLLMGVSLMILIAWYARRRNYPRDARFTVRGMAISLWRGFPSLLTPVIIIGGIALGVFTPTEAAVAASAYTLFLGTLVYRTLTFKKIMQVSLDTLETTAIILFIVAGAAIFAWILTRLRVPAHFASLLLSITENPILLLLLLNLVLFIVGFFMETIAAITILVPVLLPIAMQIGVDPVHFGIFMILNLMIGLLTPPVGMVLYVLSRVARIPFERCAKATAVFIIPLVIVLLLVTFVPALSLWLPGVFFG
ncbi:MAG: TRAP transporter large permease [Spirochaetaceae bacterium]|nr:MAG: TRAP transporter large permease [Spirochaetaceae bacterium]